MSVQACEGIWRNRLGQRLVITQCEPDDGQQWTDGDQRYSDNGSFYGRYGGCSEQDLVEHLGLLTDTLKRAPVGRPAETESTTARYISTNEALNEKTAEIDRLRLQIRESNAHCDRMRLEFTEAQQLRSENESLTVRLQRAEVAAAEALQKWETTEQLCLKIITELVKEMRR